MLLAESSPGARFACAAVRNYMRYQLADERKGIWLDTSGTTVGPLAREEEIAADHAVVKAVFGKDDLGLLDDVRCQMGFGLVSEAVVGEEEEDEDDPGENSGGGSLELSITLHNHGVSPELYTFIKAGLEHLSEDVAEFVYVSLREEMLAGLKLQRSFKTMFSSELKRCDHPRAIYELSRRTIIAVMRYNQGASDPGLRWYLNEEAIFQVIQKKRYYIRWCLEDYQEEVDRHHQQFSLTAGGNVKAVPITEAILLPEEPQLFEGDFLCR